MMITKPMQGKKTNGAKQRRERLGYVAAYLSRSWNLGMGDERRAQGDLVMKLSRNVNAIEWKKPIELLHLSHAP